MENRNSKKPFTAAVVGNTTTGPRAHLIEGYVTRDPALHQSADNQHSYVSFGIGTSVNAEATMARSEGTYTKDKEYPEGSFFDVVLFGAVAEKFCGEVTKGMKIALCGSLERNVYEAKDGSERQSIKIVASNYVRMPKDGSGKCNRRTSFCTQVYSKDGTAVSVPYTELLTGKVLSVGELGPSKTGTDYLFATMKVFVDPARIWDGANGVFLPKEDAKEKYIHSDGVVQMCFFGNQAARMSKLLRADLNIAVSGRVGKNEYTGTTTYQVFPAALSVISYPPEAPAAEAETEATPVQPTEQPTQSVEQPTQPVEQPTQPTEQPTQPTESTETTEQSPEIAVPDSEDDEDDCPF